MNRRHFFVAQAGWPALLARSGSGAPRATITTEIKRLKLRHTWTTTMSSSDYRDTLHVAYSNDGITGHGEGAPIVRYRENAEGARQAVESVRELLTAADPWQFAKIMQQVFGRVEGEWAGKAAIDIALMDWVGQKLGEAADFPVLKIKVGLDTDEATIAAVRSATDKPLRVDANEGWKDKEEAVRKIDWLAGQGVEFVEQPMPAEMLEEMHWVHSRVHVPLIADEACRHASDIPKLVGAFDGVNVKLDKAGGILEAHRMIQAAQALGLKTMLGCMVSSSVSVTAAAHLSPLVDYADLDGNLLISNDPFTGVLVKKGKLMLPDRPGLGLV